MKVRGIVVFLLILTGGVCEAQQKAYGRNQLKLHLSEVVGIELAASSAQMVNLEFKNAGDYAGGISVLMPDHLAVTSSRKFDLTARAASQYFTGHGFDVIPAGALSIEVKNTEIAGSFLRQPIESLNTQDLLLLQQVPPQHHKLLSIQYSIPPASVQEFILGKPPGLYTNAVIYTISIK